MNKTKALRLHCDDNLLVALEDLEAGEVIDVNGESYEIKESIPQKHKFTAEKMKVGQHAIMYGNIVGEIIKEINKGQWVSQDNLRHMTSPCKSGKNPHQWTSPPEFSGKSKTFMGYQRNNGQVGTANYWLMIPLVFCVNRDLEVLKEVLPKKLGFESPSIYEKITTDLIDEILPSCAKESIQYQSLTEYSKNETSSINSLFPNVDGIKFLTHAGGCGGTKEDARSLCGLLAGYITHPNVAGATVLSLGCQHAQISILKEEIQKRTSKLDKPVYYFDRQNWKSESDLQSHMIKQTLIGLKKANEIQRTPAPVSKLTLGVECGGSDGFSGISANPVIGEVSDHIIASGGSVILSEFPELCGVEQELVDRCVDHSTANRFLKLMKVYEDQAKASGVAFDANPSPGNIKDGLITDAMKSAGAVKKGGTAPVIDVLDYPQSLRKQGLSLLCTPGNDVESTTALVGTGANVILFSTGLGTPTGNPIVPVIKVSSNSEINRRLANMIDFNTGSVIDGKQSIKELGERLFECCIQTANGIYRTKADQLGQDDFIPWKRGVSL